MAMAMADPARADGPPPAPPAGSQPTTTMCTAILSNGQSCRYKARAGQEVCGVHARARAEVDEAGVDECSVCLNDMRRRRTATMECGHRFHTSCLRSWFRNRPLSCPLCRAACLEGAALLGPRLAPKLQALMRTMPPPGRGFFPAYIISRLETPRVAKALGLDDAATELLIDLACECFTQTIFFAQVRALGL